ncbi:DNA repair protein rhp26 [Dipsacomyces acuminosporus]|nr:DNA repair protein rhp26 [Dipsacomyces acuminosporus]
MSASDGNAGGGQSNELQRLSSLGVHVMAQSALERTVHDQAARAIAAHSLETEQKRLVRVDAALVRKCEQLEKAHETMGKTNEATVRYQNAAARAERLEDEIDQLKQDRRDIKERMRQINARQTESGASDVQDATGPFDIIRVKQEHDGEVRQEGESPSPSPSPAPRSILSMIIPRRRAAEAAEQRRHGLLEEDADDSSGSLAPSQCHSDSDEFIPEQTVGHGSAAGAASVAAQGSGLDSANASDESYHDDEDEDISADELSEQDATPSIARKTYGIPTDAHDMDDGNEHMYQERVYSWCIARWRERQGQEQGQEPNEAAAGSQTPNADDFIVVDDDNIPRADLAKEPFLPDPSATDHYVRAHDSSARPLAVPHQVWSRLLEYQKAAIRWMFALHQQNAGGILGDEMGLGKTVQVVAFLASLYHSRLLNRPSIIVCPATLMRQWVREFHTWWPSLRVVILHATGHGMKQAVSDGPGKHGQRYEIAGMLPANVEEEIWDDAHAQHDGFAGNTASNAERAGAGVADDYGSADEYEYDAYGSRVRRKRRRGTHGHQLRQRLKKRKKNKRVLSKTSRANLKRAEALVDRIHEHGHVVIVTYSGLQVYQDSLLRRKWGYAVLDEGHMIRNPDAEATLACKRLDTRHRLLVTGTPIQNNLTELWSLFDFIFPGRLGTLPVFNNQFATPITVGGYASANSLQVRAAYRCACILRDLIDPYLLRRLKADVAQDLPQKTEQVLFCRLTPIQRSAYMSFLRSVDMERILSGNLQMLFGVDVARKICDHPDLLLLSTLPSAASTYSEAQLTGRRLGVGDHNNESTSGSESEVDIETVNQRDGGGDVSTSGVAAGSDDEFGAENTQTASRVLPADYGDWQKSGKLTIVRALLDMWRPQGHKVLIFSQTRQMLDIIERMFVQMRNVAYRRMDGSTPVQRRTSLVDEFNRDPGIFVFLLTTKVGGLGVNLTGADRVILYSPDWNPSSDMQARERAWRLGQTRDVAIYRLMTAGTIEEKIYNRQIYKQFLSNKILSDPKQKRVFQSQSLRDLFSLTGFDAGEEVVAGINASADTRVGGSGAQPSSDGVSGNADADSLGSSDRTSAPTTETGRMFAKAQLLPKPARPWRNRRDADSSGSGGNDEEDTGNDDGLSTTPGIERIGGVVRLEEYRHTSDDDQSSSEGPSNGSAAEQSDVLEGEDRVLQSLFKMSGMHSALKHDAIVNADEEDTQAIEHEAGRIAIEARTALRQSQRARRQVEVSIPTWTGASGEAGMPTGSGAPHTSDSMASVGLVAPPPSAILNRELPPEVRYRGLQALGSSSRPRSTPPARQVMQESLVSSAGMLVRRAKMDRQLPASRSVASLSVDQGPGGAGSRTGAQFGSYSVSGMYTTSGDRGGTGNALSSANLLANLRARSAGIQAVNSSARNTQGVATSPNARRGSKVAPLKASGVQDHRQRKGQNGRIQPIHLHSPRTLQQHARANKRALFGQIAPVEPRESSAGATGESAIETGDARREMGAADGGAADDNDAVVVERIRSAIEQNGGELSSRKLIELFESEFSVAKLPRLKVLALQVADLVTRRLDNRSTSSSSSTSHAGIGRAVQRVWRLRGKRASI